MPFVYQRQRKRPKLLSAQLTKSACGTFAFSVLPTTYNYFSSSTPNFSTYLKKLKGKRRVTRLACFAPTVAGPTRIIPSKELIGQSKATKHKNSHFRGPNGEQDGTRSRDDEDILFLWKNLLSKKAHIT